MNLKSKAARKYAYLLTEVDSASGEYLARLEQQMEALLPQIPAEDMAQITARERDHARNVPGRVGGWDGKFRKAPYTA